MSCAGFIMRRVRQGLSVVEPAKEISSMAGEWGLLTSFIILSRSVNPSKNCRKILKRLNQLESFTLHHAEDIATTLKDFPSRLLFGPEWIQRSHRNILCRK